MPAVIGLDFDEASHTYQYQGKVVPSVTQVLEPYSGLEHVPEDVLEATGEFGNHVHLATHLHDIGELDREALDPRVNEYLIGWEKFLDEAGAVPIYSEMQIYSNKLGVAGTLDRIMGWTRSKHNIMVDIKTGSSITKTVGPQTAAYEEIYHEMTGQRRMQRYCVHLRPFNYSLVKLQDPNDINIFRAALTLHRWINK
jgi:hypothetical protein